jgi:branched-chain amino acid transport system substrate-binding protein
LGTGQKAVGQATASETPSILITFAFLHCWLKVGVIIMQSVFRLSTFAAGLLAAQAALAADPIKIGVTLSLSPPGSVPQGTVVKDSLEVTAKMINDAGGALGRPFELIMEDDQGIPEKARAATEKLITRDKVVAIVGEHQSSAVLAGIEVAHRYHVPYINTNGFADPIREKGYVEVFSPAGYNTLLAIAIADAVKGLGAKRATAFCENTDFGIGIGKAIGESLKERAPSVEYRTETLDRAAKDFLPALLPLKANPPDVVVDCMLPPASYILINQVFEQGIAPSRRTWLYSISFDYPDFWQNVSDAAKTLIGNGYYHPNMTVPELGRKIAAAYKTKTGFEPSRLLFQAADSLFIVA